MNKNAGFGKKLFYDKGNRISFRSVKLKLNIFRKITKGIVKMLLITARPQDKIILDNGVTITICRVDGQQTRIGVEAPASVNITRKNALQKKHLVSETPISDITVIKKSHKKVTDLT